MVKFKITDYTGRCYSNEDGQIIYDLIIAPLSNGKTVFVSFEGVDTVTSSFVNSAFIELLETLPFQNIKTHLKFESTRKSIGELIRSRFDFEVNRRDRDHLILMA